MAEVAVVGPGAVGATFAAAAERAGHGVALCGRTPAPAPVVELPDGTEHALAGSVRTDSSAAAPVAWVLLAVKTHQVAGAAPWLTALCAEGTTVIALQNGVEHERLARPLIGRAELLPAIVWCPAEVVAPGRVAQRGEARISVPEGPAGAAAADLLAGAAVVDRVPDFAAAAWHKLCLNAAAAPMVVAGRRAELYRDPEQRELARAIAAEGVAVARAAGVVLDPGLPDAIAEQLVAMPPDLGTSMLFDRLAGRPLEWEARNGVIRRLGRRHGVPTPVSDVLVPLLAALSPPERPAPARP
jgi:2-dehydropantoate 2-reductase